MSRCIPHLGSFQSVWLLRNALVSLSSLISLGFRLLTTFQFSRDSIPLSPSNITPLPAHRRLRCYNQHPNRLPRPRNFRFLPCSRQLSVLLYCMPPHGTRKLIVDFLGCCFPSDIFKSNVLWWSAYPSMSDDLNVDLADSNIQCFTQSPTL